ncbi:MAG: hypothetical protein JJE52_03985 [Acidimicrobiia bacterium]|nr:hypothetical protein [Acidimicrobiia bacterium]
MSKKTPGQKPRKKRQAPKPSQPRTRQAGPAHADAPPLDGEAVQDDGELLVAAWDASRSGARAGRGFHFQDAVGAWLAARVAAGDVAAASVTPEGLDDIVLEGDPSAEIQVKSRVEHLGRFPSRLASHHILDAWNRHAGRAREIGRLIVVLERGVDGEESLSSLDQCLADSLGDGSVLRAALMDLAAERGMSQTNLGEMLVRTVVLAITWEMLAVETASFVGALVDVPPSALELIARQLRVLVAEASDANVVLEYGSRRTLTRTEVVSAISHLASHIDQDALEFALRDGICEVFDLSHAAGGDRYYEGTATQPFHVAAGLVVPRPGLVAEVLAGLSEHSAVVITGPSGVGKSAVLWTIPLATPGVLWFRVRRLAPGDVPALIRLTRAHKASESAPVGFIVDAVGAGDIRGWARLRTDAASEPGVLLLGSARMEDLPTLGDLSGCATVTVALNEAAAQVIFDGLVRRGATSAHHWREAFERSNGLTLEFTHLLTQGRRLDDVIQEQVRRRIEEGRWDELDVLSLVSVADMWAATLPSADVAAACGATRLALRQATTRLAEEHLVVERDGVMSGRHRLRSAAISSAIHAQPPPDLGTTVGRVLELIPANQLHRFVASAVSDEPSAADAVIETAAAEPLQLDRLVAYLHGLRLGDFHDLATKWRAIAEDHEVPASSQPVLFQFAAAGLTFPDFFPEALRSASSEMTAVSGPNRADKLAGTIGHASLAGVLVGCDSAVDAARLLSTLPGAGPHFTSAARDLMAGGCPLVEALAGSSIEELADCLAAARLCDPPLAMLLADLIGGQPEMLLRLRDENPWVTYVDVRLKESETPEASDELIGYCRLLHLSDELQGDPRQQALSVGRLLLRCLPNIESVDVQALMPGGHELRIGDYTHGVSGLRRQYDHSSLSVAWNQARLRAAVTLLGDTDTARLAAALPLLDTAEHVAREAGVVLVGRAAKTDFAELAQTVADLHERARSLKPPLGTIEIGDTSIGEEAPIPMADDLSGLLTDLTGNILPRLSNRENYRALEAYIAETTIGRHLIGATQERWHLLGIDGHPASLDRLRDALADLHAVVHELTIDGADFGKVGRSARSTVRAQALHQAAETCRREERRRQQARREGLQRVCSATRRGTKVLRPPPNPLPGTSTAWAVTIELDSLLDWPDTVDDLISTLSPEQRLGESCVLIPLRAGRPVPSLSVKLMGSAFPATSIDEWAPQLGKPHPTSLADTVAEAQRALQALSGILELPDHQCSHPLVEAAASQAAADFLRAREELLVAPSDPLTQELLSVVDALAAEVQAEIDGSSSGAGVAAQVAAGALHASGGSVFDTIVGARYFALEWDIDRALAVDLLQSPGVPPRR